MPERTAVLNLGVDPALPAAMTGTEASAAKRPSSAADDVTVVARCHGGNQEQVCVRVLCLFAAT